jgi:hypothetical protein
LLARIAHTVGNLELISITRRTYVF